MSFLVGGASITFELVVIAQGLGVAKVSQAARDGRVLFHVDAEIEKVFVFACDLKIIFIKAKAKPTGDAGLTVSQLRHLVSLVRMPWNKSLIQVCLASLELDC